MNRIDSFQAMYVARPWKAAVILSTLIDWFMSFNDHILQERRWSRSTTQWKCPFLKKRCMRKTSWQLLFSVRERARSLLGFEHEGHRTKTLPNKQRFYARLSLTLRLRHIHIRWPSTPLIERTPTLKYDAGPAHKMDFMDLSFCFVFFENKHFDLKWRFRATWPMKTLRKSRSNWGLLVTKTLRFLHSNLL